MLFRSESYRLLEDSGGPGLNRGGLGIERILTMETDSITVSAIFNRMTVDPFGLHGGKPGMNSGIYVRFAGSAEWQTFTDAFGTDSPSKFANLTLRRGDQVRIVAPGGGGWGDPLERPIERVKADLDEGFITPTAAQSQYGVSASLAADGTWSVAPAAGRGK